MVRTVRTPLYGVRELDRALKNIGDAAGTSVMEAAMMDAAEPLLAEMQSRVQVRTGRTKGLLSIWSVVTGVSRKVKIGVGAGIGVFWARYLELGTVAGTKGAKVYVGGRRRRQYRNHSGARAYPFARPAWEVKKLEVLDLFIQRIRIHLKREAVKHAAPRHPKRR
ncbi:HK97 gp10 family phage protein [Caulobacter sp. ErkDOM-E]|uniref:HK97 gp10 family phage protein n=1 Tax=Caulobacter sp. ErkDOM-E TaxID=3402778 RepID=UPI003AF731FB